MLPATEPPTPTGSTTSSPVPTESSAISAKPIPLACTAIDPFWIVEKQTFVPASELAPGDTFLTLDGGHETLESIHIEYPEPGESFTTHNFEVADYHTYFAGEDAVWVHNAGNACHHIFSLYDRYKLRFRKTPEQAWKDISGKYDGKFGTATKKHTNRAMGTALDESMLKDVYPGRTDPLWSQGRMRHAPENMYEHFQKHVLDLKDMLSHVDNPVGYVKRAHQYGNMITPTPNVLVYEGISPRSGVLERFVFNTTTNEFTVKVLQGAEAGAVRTLHVRPAGQNWFVNEMNKIGALSN